MTTYLAKQGVVYSDPSTGEVLSILEELETPGTEYLNIQLLIILMSCIFQEHLILECHYQMKKSQSLQKEFSM